MKNIFILLLLAASGYGVYWAFEEYSGKAATRAAREVSGDHLKRAQRQLERSADRIERVKAETVRNAVARFKVDKARLPESLDELVRSGYLDHVPSGVSYDAASGEVGAGE